MKGVDLLKFFFALVVVWIHTGTNSLYGLTHIAVPFFFVMSGFFLFGKVFSQSDVAHRQAVVTKWLKGVLWLYLLWTIIFLPFAVIGFVKEGMPLMKSVVVWFRNVVFVGENYLSWPLWYLLGMIWAGIIILVFVRLRLPLWSLFILALLLFVFPYILPDIFETGYYKSLFETTRNGLFIGFPFIMAGGLLRLLLKSAKAWKPDTWQHSVGLWLRFFSVHIYLTHMLWVGAYILCNPDYQRGVFLWGVGVLASLATGLLVGLLPWLQKLLYGRVYVRLLGVST